MPLHLVKLAVGCGSLKELKGWVAERIQAARKNGQPPHHIHVTRMVPKRVDELLAGGSLYWVIRGEIAARERIVAIEPFRDRDGIGRCRLVLQPKVIAVLCDRCARSRAGAISSPATPRPISDPRVPVSQTCPNRCAVNCANSDCCKSGAMHLWLHWRPSARRRLARRAISKSESYCNLGIRLH